MTESLPSGMPPGISRRLTMTPMELGYEGAIQYIAGRNPASLLRTKTLPVYQILVAPTPAPHIKESSYGVGRQPLNESGRRWGRGLGLERGANNGLDSRYVKYRINSFKKGGSLSRTVTGLSTLVTTYGPMNLGPSLRAGSLRGMSRVDNQTF